MCFLVGLSSLKYKHHFRGGLRSAEYLIKVILVLDIEEKVTPEAFGELPGFLHLHFHYFAGIH